MAPIAAKGNNVATKRLLSMSKSIDVKGHAAVPYALALNPATLDPCPTSYSLAEIVEMIKLSHPGRLVVLLAVICCALTAAHAEGPAADEQNAGQGVLDRATELRLTTRSLPELLKIVELCEMALDQGLEKENQDFARQLLTATLYEHAAKHSELIFEQQPPDPRWPGLRTVAAGSLEKLLEYDDTMASAHYLYARLQLLPRGDRDKATRSLEKIIELSADDPPQMSKALVLRSQLADDVNKAVVDLNQALELDPENTEALQRRGLLYLSSQRLDEAVEDLTQILEKDETDVIALQAVGEALTQLEKYGEAQQFLDKAIEASPDSPINYLLRSRLHHIEGNQEAAIEDLNETIRRAPKNLPALLMRAQYRLEFDDLELAEGDVDRALQLQPGHPQAIMLRSMIHTMSGRYSQAIADLRRLMRNDADNTDLQLRIATLLLEDGRPLKAIDAFDEVIERHPDHWLARRSRADSMLGVGRHDEAIKEYERVLEQKPDESGALNNLSWVLATSTVDELRDGQRSLELAQKACEVTEYKLPHVISTLAAAHAELGNFEQAIEWSTKAVELENPDHQEQLELELESYRNDKPWRERTVHEGKADSEQPSDDDLDLN